MKYNDNGEWKDIIVKATDTLPIGTEVDYNGTDVPDGWEEVEDYSSNEINTHKLWIDGSPIYRKVLLIDPETDVLQTLTPHNITNIKEMLPTCCAIFHRTNGQYVPMSMVYPHSAENILNWSLGWQITKTNIETWIGPNMRAQMASTPGCVIILEYTKTI